MNYRFILKTLGSVLLIEALLLFFPVCVALYYNEQLLPYIYTIILLILFGGLLSTIKIKNKNYYAKDGLMITALSWIALSIFGALPFVISNTIPSFVDAFFETVSGFTTTGSTILKDVEMLSKGILFWRSFTHWIGGMGILVFTLAILPLTNDNSMHMLKAEAPGPFTSKLVPKLRQTAIWLYSIYSILTIMQIILLVLGGMPLFDSVLTAFSTAGTGGFGIKNNSIAFYNSAYIDYVISIFMILFGVNFNVFFLIIMKKFKQAFSNEEVRTYFIIIAIATILITINLLSIHTTFSDSFRLSLFQVGSIITTTGFSTTDFNLWPQISKTIIFILMIIGACGGSTGGGIKVSRLIIVVKSTINSFIAVLHPKSVRTIRIENKLIDDKTTNLVGFYLILYFIIIFVATLLISIDNFDFETTITSVVTCISNVGPGFGFVGPLGNFSAFSSFSKIILAFVMLFGRLELYPMLLFFSPFSYLKKNKY